MSVLQLVIILMMVSVIWVLPIYLIDRSPRSANRGKGPWYIAVIFFSRIAYFVFLAVVPSASSQGSTAE